VVQTPVTMSDTEKAALDGGFPESAVWPIDYKEGKAATYSMGDPVTGPNVLLVDYPAGASGYRSPTHSHRSDSFRVAVGPGAQQFRDGARWFGHGDFLLMGANDRYVETLGTDGMYMAIVSADRRGWPHGYEQNASNEDSLAEWPATFETYFANEKFWAIHESDDQAIIGTKASIASNPPDPKGERRVWGNFSNREGWHVMSDGTEVAVMLFGDPEHGAAVILSHNSPNSVEIGRHHLGTDTFRLVIDGSVHVGDSRFGTGQYRQSMAGSDEDAVVHGPEGSNQVLILADRAAVLLTSEDQASTTQSKSTQWGELLKQLAALTSA
jgi:hypothetical protein